MKIIIVILFILFIFLLSLSCRRKYTLLTGGSDNRYTFKRYPKFCCDDDPIPLTPDQYKLLIERENLDEDTKFLHQVLHDSNIRVIVEFDTSNFQGKTLYTKKLTNICEKHGRNIYYQIAVMNDYSLHDYPKKDKYNINVYFITNDDQKNKMYTKNYYNTVVAAKLFLNTNSIEFLKYQDLDRFNSFQMKNTRIMFNTLLNFLNINADLYDQETVISFHGIISYFLGLRMANDIDMNTINNKNLYHKLLQNITTDIIDYSDNDDFTRYAIKKDMADYKLNNICDLFFDPKNYMYFLGLKCYSLELHLKSRYIRNRPNAIAEIIALDYKTTLNYPLPKIPDKNYIVSFGKWKDIIPETQKKYLPSQDDLNIEENKINKERFLSTIKFYLFKKYNLSLSLEEIKKYYI